MGWNPYNCLSSHAPNAAGCWPPTETTLRKVAATLKSTGLQKLGYGRINLDGGWALKERDNKTGRVVPNPAFFPNGFSKLSDDLEALGYHFGLYSDSGTKQCGGDAPGSLGHEDVDAQSYADWGVSYLKYDNCFASDCTEFGCGNAPNETTYRYTAMSKALNKTKGRHGPILFSMCEWGVANPVEWGAAVSNMWRTTADISDVWVYLILKMSTSQKPQFAPDLGSKLCIHSHRSRYMCELADLTAEWFDRAGPGGT